MFAPFNAGARIARPRKDLPQKRTTDGRPYGLVRCRKFGVCRGAAFHVGRGRAPAVTTEKPLFPAAPRRRPTGFRAAAPPPNIPTNQNLKPLRRAVREACPYGIQCKACILPVGTAKYGCDIKAVLPPHGGRTAQSSYFFAVTRESTVTVSSEMSAWAA